MSWDVVWFSLAEADLSAGALGDRGPHRRSRAASRSDQAGAAPPGHDQRRGGDPVARAPARGDRFARPPRPPREGLADSALRVLADAPSTAAPTPDKAIHIQQSAGRAGPGPAGPGPGGYVEQRGTRGGGGGPGPGSTVEQGGTRGPAGPGPGPGPDGPGPGGFVDRRRRWTATSSRCALRRPTLRERWKTSGTPSRSSSRVPSRPHTSSTSHRVDVGGRPPARAREGVNESTTSCPSARR